jgi:hypothetical protein
MFELSNAVCLIHFLEVGSHLLADFLLGDNQLAVVVDDQLYHWIPMIDSADFLGIRVKPLDVALVESGTSIAALQTPSVSGRACILNECEGQRVYLGSIS